MDRFAVSHFSDRALLHDLKSLIAHDRRATAVLLTRIAEVDERQLYRQAGYDSMFAYCLHELHFSEDAAYRHINAARVSRRFPAVLVALAEGRLHLRAVLMLSRHLTSGNADELVAAATHKTRAEIELLLVQRFPRPDLPQRLQPIPLSPVPTPVTTPPAPALVGELAPERVEATIPDSSVPQPAPQLAPERVEAMIPDPGTSRPAPQLAPERVEAPAPRPRGVRRRGPRAGGRRRTRTSGLSAASRASAEPGARRSPASRRTRRSRAGGRPRTPRSTRSCAGRPGGTRSRSRAPGGR